MKSHTFELTPELRHAVAYALTFEYYPKRRIGWMVLLVLYIIVLSATGLYIFVPVLGLWLIIAVSLSVSLGFSFVYSYLQTWFGLRTLARSANGHITVRVNAKNLQWGSGEAISTYSYDVLRHLILLDRVALVVTWERSIIFIPVSPQAKPVLTALGKKIK